MPIHLSEEEKKPQHCLLNVRKPFLSVSRAWTELRKYFNCKRNVKSHPSSYWKTYYQMLKPFKKKICDYPKVDHRSLFSKGWPSRITKDKVTKDAVYLLIRNYDASIKKLKNRDLMTCVLWMQEPQLLTENAVRVSLYHISKSSCQHFGRCELSLCVRTGG